MSVSAARAFRAASAVLCCLGFAASALAAGEDGRALWRESVGGGKSAAQARSFALDLDGFSALAAKRAGPVALPLAGGGFASFELEDAGTLAPALAQRYPQLRSLRGRDESGRRLRLDISPAGVNAMIFADDGVQVIRPHGKRGQHESFARAAVARAADRCETDAEPAPLAAALDALAPLPAAKSGDTGGVRRSYRLALAATGEYTAAVCAPAAPDTVCGLAAMVASINRVNEIYETDLAVRLVLVAGNDQLVYTDAATDPYTNGNAAALLDENQSNLTNTLGNGAYDIGHVFGTGNVGRASIGVTCKTGSKARGATGRANPQGDPFDVDFVAHEIGHQFHANHTFNGNAGSCAGTNRVPASAFEPGSGSSIMGYAGLCGAQNLQAHSDPYFHAHSLAEMQAEIAADTCDAELPADNKAAMVDTLPDHTIPARTPFALRASASDADGDALTYAWEQFDLGAVQGGAQPDATATDGPLLRSWPPTPDPERSVPNLATLLGAPPAKGEVLPQATRTLAFRASVRDNHPGGGSVSHADTTVHVVDTGAAFAILAPNAPDTTWTCGRDETVHWDVAGTAQAPIGCGAVDVLLSTDGGVAFDRVLASGVPNSGSAVLRVPFAPGANARLQVRCSDNIFFAVNASDFTVADAGTVAVDDGLTTAPEDVERTIATAALLGNDSGGGALHVTGVSNAVGGSVWLVDGAIKFVPQPDRVGDVGFDYGIADSCERPQPASATGRVRFDLAPVNDAPVLAPLRDLKVTAQKGASGAIQGFAVVEHFGAADEAGQQVQAYLVGMPDDGGGVVTDVSIDPDGTLRATLGGVTGTATVAVRVRDDGGTAGGGADTSAERSFTITASDQAGILVGIDATAPTVTVGDSVHYVVTLENVGDTGIASAHLRQSLPEGVGLAQWTCDADEATCPAPTGTGPLDLLLPIRAGGRFTFVVTAVVQVGAGAVLHAEVDASVAHDDGTAVAQQSDAAETAVLRRDVFADGLESD